MKQKHLFCKENSSLEGLKCDIHNTDYKTKHKKIILDCLDYDKITLTSSKGKTFVIKHFKLRF